MFPRNLAKTFRSVALLGVVSLGVAACDEPADTNITFPENQSISLTPQSVTMFPDQTVQLSAAVTGVENPQVTFRSSDETVATVSSAGVVSSVAPGIATITATVTNAPNLSASSVINVNARPGGETGGDASVSIGSIVNPNNTQVIPDSVAGDIFVRLNVEPGNATQLRVLLGDDVVCTQDFSTTSGQAAAAKVDAKGHLDLTQAQVEIVCPINTDAFEIDPATGQAVIRYPNGVRSLRAELVTPQGTVAAATSTQLNLRNQDFVSVRVDVTTDTLPAVAVNPRTGLAWAEGDVTVTAIPVVFSGRTVGGVRLGLFPSGTVGGGFTGLTNVDTSAPFSVTFSGEDELANVVGRLRVFATATDATGAELSGLAFTRVEAGGTAGGALEPTRPGATAGSSIPGFLRYDNRAPEVAGTVTDTTFVPAGFTFNRLTTGVTQNDEFGGIGNEIGVNAVRFEYFVGTAAQTEAQVLATTPITDVSTLNETRTNNALRLVVRSCDALNNCSTVSNAVGGTSILFGVDKTAPEILSVTVPGTTAPNRVNPTGEILVTYRDTLSGFGPAPLLVRATQILPAGERCGTTFGGNAALPGTAGATCGFEGFGLTGETQATVPVLEEDGYYRYQIRVRDEAGNVSTDTTVLFLEDDVAPVVNAATIGFQAPLEGGTIENFTARLTDNVDLAAYTFNVDYAGGTAAGGVSLPFIQATPINAFGPPAVGSHTAEANVFWVRCIVNGAGAATGVTFGASDFAGLVGAGSGSVPTQTCGTLSAGASSPISVSISPSDIDDDQNSVTVIARVTIDNVNASAPFARVFFYANPNSTGAQLIGVDESGAMETTATQRIFTYTATYNTSDLSAAGGDSVNFFVLGAESDGDAAISAEITEVVVD